MGADFFGVKCCSQVDGCWMWCRGNIHDIEIIMDSKKSQDSPVHGGWMLRNRFTKWRFDRFHQRKWWHWIGSVDKF